ncbi:hypothetical protein [Ruminococcus sp.]|uniref:hypothetical protein n=1 Tax=Ruminococcus sp. TaxID=41978 RepID=UPI0039950A92
MGEEKMLHNLKKKLYPMNSDLENLTLAENKKIINISISIFLVAIQIVYCFSDNIDLSILDSVFSSKDLADFLLGILINATTFSVIYFIVKLIWQKVWIGSNRDNCYLEGTWYHVFEREVDKDKNCVRGGIIKISQNFYDVSVNAYNYDIYINNGKITYNSSSFSNWFFSSCDLQKDGRLDAKFVKRKEYSESSSDSGTMNLSVFDVDTNGNICEMVGGFSDSGSSTTRGNIRLFKAKQSVAIANTSFVDRAPNAWKEYIRQKLEQ